MQISFTVSRQAAILGGYNQSGLVTVDVDMASLDQADRQLLAAAVASDGRIVASYPAADAPTVDGLLEMLRDQAAEDAASADLEVENVNARAEENLRKREPAKYYDTLYAPTGAPYPHEREFLLVKARGRESEISAWHSPDWAAWQAEIATENARRAAAAQAEREAKEAALAAEKAAAAAAKAERAAKLRAWAEAHGSELTRARLAEGYDCWHSSARQDIAAAVTSRFTAAGFAEQTATDGSAEPRKCPTLDEITALRKARNVASEITEWPTSVSLYRVEYEPSDEYANYEDGDRAEPTYATEICVEIDIWGETETLWFLAD